MPLKQSRKKRLKGSTRIRKVRVWNPWRWWPLEKGEEARFSFLSKIEVVEEWWGHDWSLVCVRECPPVIDLPPARAAQ